MKFRSPLVAPRRTDRTVLPAALVAVLAVMFAVQCFSSNEVELPPALPVGASVARVEVPKIIPVPVPGVIGARPLFAPRQAMTGADQAKPPALGGAVVAGSITIRGRAFAVVRRLDRSIVNLPVGGAIAGWRLVSLSPEGARFVKGGERLVLAYGAAAIAPPDEADAEEED